MNISLDAGGIAGIAITVAAAIVTGWAARVTVLAARDGREMHAAVQTTLDRAERLASDVERLVAFERQRAASRIAELGARGLVYSMMLPGVDPSRLNDFLIEIQGAQTLSADLDVPELGDLHMLFFEGMSDGWTGDQLARVRPTSRAVVDAVRDYLPENSPY